MPGIIKKLLRSKIFGGRKSSADRKEAPIDWILRNRSPYDLIGHPGQLTSDVFDKIKGLPGWFNFDDCAHFYLILSMQSVLGVQGDLFEIGSYHGRSTALMAYCLKDNEVIHVCDTFDIDAGESYSRPPTPDSVLKNILLVNPCLTPSRVIIHRCLSDELSLKANQLFRFIHIDGGHSKEQTFRDLVLCQRHLIHKGIIAVDDFYHPDFPGVKEGVQEFLLQYPDFFILADLNRHGALGRKLYVINQSKNDM